MSSDGNGNMIVHKPAPFPNGFTATATCNFTSDVVFNQVAMDGLNTPTINIQMPGLASHASVDNTETLVLR